MIDGDKDPQKIVEEKGLKQQSDPKALEALIDKIINDNREKAIEYKQGKEKLFGFFVGQAMKASAVKDIDNDLIEIFPKDTATKANQTLKSAFEFSEMGIKIDRKSVV